MPYHIHIPDTLCPAQEERLLEIWEQSVRATHDFLSEKDILSLRPAVSAGLSAEGTLVCARDDSGIVFAFLLAASEKIEMLFVDPALRGTGIGRALVEFAIDRLHIRYVDVNEQNTQGVGFYRHLGFAVFRRSERDPQGNPFPILHLRLQGA